MNRLLDRIADPLVNRFIDVLEWCEKHNINPVKTKHFGG